jgi:hypothetical protein
MTKLTNAQLMAAAFQGVVRSMVLAAKCAAGTGDRKAAITCVIKPDGGRFVDVETFAVSDAGMTCVSGLGTATAPPDEAATKAFVTFITALGLDPADLGSAKALIFKLEGPMDFSEPLASEAVMKLTWWRTRTAKRNIDPAALQEFKAAFEAVQVPKELGQDAQDTVS